MTTAEFQQKFPKPWKFVNTRTGFSLRAANGEPVAFLQLHSYHSGVPQREWNQHVADALRGVLEIVDTAKLA